MNFTGRREVPLSLWCSGAMALLLSLSAVESRAAEPCGEGQRSASVAQRAHGVDPHSPLHARVAPPSPDAIASYLESGLAYARAHQLTSAQMEKVDRALAALPALHRRILQAHLRHLSFIEVPAGAGSGLTARVSDGDFPLFDLTLRAGILDESLSEFLTIKEQMVFAEDGSGTTVSVDAPGDALTYVLLHEATHIVDLTLGITAGLDPRFTGGIWLDRRELDARWAARPIASTAFRRTLRRPVSSAPALYASLADSPFVSLYATAAAPEDLAELVAWRELSVRSSEPLRISVRSGSGELIYSLAPLAKTSIKQRFEEVDKLLAACPAGELSRSNS